MIDEEVMTSPIHHHARLSFLLVLMMIPSCLGRRYRRCQDGCCIHEYCAYGLVCYPRIHCHFGCPDGYCTGAEQFNRDGAKHAGRRFIKSSTPEENVSKSRVGVKGHITENYSHSDKFENQNLSGVDKEKPEGKSAGSSPISEGICMPLPPCKKSDKCGMGRSCSHNFNLGYSVCQYNLDIGTTLCYDTHGNYAVKPMH